MESLSVNRSTDPRRIDLDGKVLVAHQPEFLPWLGNISKATMGDMYLIMDHLQFEKEHWQSRNRIRISGGTGWQYLTVPLLGTNKIQNTLDVRIFQNGHWAQKHLKSIRFSYGKCPFFMHLYPKIEQIYAKKHTFLIDLLLDFLNIAFSEFKINVPVFRSSELVSKGILIKGAKSKMLSIFTTACNADIFVFGRDGKKYVDRELFAEAGIKPIFQEFNHPQYTQIQGGFIEGMSFIDLLFNQGSESAIDTLGRSSYSE